MSIVTLLSGGLDSCLMSLMIHETKKMQKLLFVNYGQLNYQREYNSARLHSEAFNLSEPTKLDLSGFGKVITSGLTDSNQDIVDDAFLPGRNLLLLLSAASFAVKNNCNTIALGLLNEETTIFPDQTDDFIFSAEYTLRKALGTKIEIIAPLRGFYKSDVVQLAREKNIQTYYSCHKGDEKPCGECISCKEFDF